MQRFRLCHVAYMSTKKADDFIIGTGKLHSVEDFAKIAFKYVNLNYKDFLRIDKKFKREKIVKQD